MCKSHKHAGNGDAVRVPWPAVKEFPVMRGLNRHDPGLFEGCANSDEMPVPTWEEPWDCPHGCNGDPPCADQRCTFTCHPHGGYRQDLPLTTPWKSRKDRRRWCGGHKGREHVPVVTLNAWGNQACGMRDRIWRRPPEWVCYHAVTCARCGKVLQYRAPECPDEVGWRYGSKEEAVGRA
jgi:hypothetical protein